MSLSSSPAVPALAGVVAAVVGYAGSVAVVLQGLRAMGADEAEIASALLALGLAMGLPAIVLSLRLRIPVSVAWSTPGAAMLAGTGALAGGFAEAVGAFAAAGALLLGAGLWRPFGRWVASMPSHIASALLAGVLLGLCLAPVSAVAQFPALTLAVILVWAVFMRLARVWAVPAAALALGIGLALGSNPPSGLALALPAPLFVAPHFTLAGCLGVGVPLFLVTMASQNVPGLAILKLNGYEPALGPLLRGTGLASLLAAPFGAVSVNLAAITAQLCAGPDAGPLPGRRWIAGVASGLAYIVFGLFATLASAIFLATPPILIEAVAGLALLGAFGNALAGATRGRSDHLAAALTFAVTAGGHSFLGLGSALWGLAVGLCAHAALLQETRELPDWLRSGWLRGVSRKAKTPR